MLGTDEVLIGMAALFAVLWLPLVAAFVTGKLNDRRERSNGNGQPL